jgi:hypothetical protein
MSASMTICVYIKIKHKTHKEGKVELIFVTVHRSDNKISVQELMNVPGWQGPAQVVLESIIKTQDMF